MASERVEVRFMGERFSMFRLRVHADPNNLLSIVEVDCYRSPILTVTNAPTVKSLIERYGIDAVILSVRPREFHCRLLMDKASVELARWREEAQTYHLFESFQADINPILTESKIVPAPGIIRKGRKSNG